MQTAIIDGEKVVASLIPQQQWDELRMRQKSVTRDDPIARDPFGFGQPMSCKTHGRTGLHFFSFYPHVTLPAGFDADWLGNESPEHAITKAFIVSMAETFGYQAECEKPVPLADGRHRIADTVVTFPDSAGRRPLAIEIQITKQDDLDFEQRTRDYHDTGYDCAWLDFNLMPHSCTNPLDPAMELERHTEYSLRDGTYECSEDMLKSFRWDGVEPIRGALRFPFRIDMDTRTFAVWFDHDWKDLDVWLYDFLERPDSFHPRPRLSYVRLFSARRCEECDSARRFWANDAMIGEIRRARPGDCVLNETMTDRERHAIEEFAAAMAGRMETFNDGALLARGDDGHLHCPRCGRTLGTAEMKASLQYTKAAIPLEEPGRDASEEGWTYSNAWADDGFTAAKEERFVRTATSLQVMEDTLGDIREWRRSHSPLNIFHRKRMGWHPSENNPNDLDAWMEPLDELAAEKAYRAARMLAAGNVISDNNPVFSCSGDDCRLDPLPWNR